MTITAQKVGFLILVFIVNQIFDQAMQNVKNLAKEENKENQKFTLLNLYWDNFKKDLENFDDLYKNKQENPFLKNSISPLRDILKSDISGNILNT